MEWLKVTGNSFKWLPIIIEVWPVGYLDGIIKFGLDMILRVNRWIVVFTLVSSRK